MTPWNSAPDKAEALYLCCHVLNTQKGLGWHLWGKHLVDIVMDLNKEGRGAEGNVPGRK